ncbi:hypothetical protein [Novipirellula rosea]
MRHAFAIIGVIRGQTFRCRIRRELGEDPRISNADGADLIAIEECEVMAMEEVSAGSRMR